MYRLSLFVCACALLTGTTAHAQPSKNVSFKTSDGLNIAATLLSAKTPDTKSPSIVFIHQGGSSRKEWIDSPLWKQLAAEGFTLLAYDIRMHGESEKDPGDLMDLFNNPKRSPNDLRAAIKYLKSQASVDPNRIAIVGASIGANLACVASADNSYGIKSAVSLSAKTSAVQNLSGINKSIAPQNVYHIASEKEQNGLREKWAKELHDKTTGKRKVSIAKGAKHGSFILTDSPDLVTAIATWLKETL